MEEGEILSFDGLVPLPLHRDRHADGKRQRRQRVGIEYKEWLQRKEQQADDRQRLPVG
ncbi:hypothetical protein D3C87_2040180 [compost metagenome]